MEGTELAVALSPVLTTLAADGYVGSYVVEGATLQLSISAGPEACADCLSPKPIMSRLVANALAAAGLGYDVELTYPTDASGDRS